MKKKFIWLGASHFAYLNVFLSRGTIEDEKLDKTPDLGKDTCKISRLGVSMKKFPEAIFGQVGISPQWIRMGVVFALYVQGLSFPFTYFLFY